MPAAGLPSAVAMIQPPASGWDSPYSQLIGYGSTFNGVSVAAGSGVLDTRTEDRVLRCFSDDGEAEMYVEQSQVAVTPIDGLTTTVLPAPAP